MTYNWTDPQTGGLILQNILDDLSYLKGVVDGLTGATPANLANYIPTFGTTADGSGLTVSLNNVLVTTVAIPVGGRVLGAYASGVNYPATSIVTASTGAYIAAVAFKSTTLAADIASGNLRMFAPAGAPAVNRTGAWVSTQTYNIGDGVTITTPLQTAQGVVQIVSQWVLSVAAPAGTAPGFGSTYWSLLAGPSAIDTTLLNDSANGYGVLSTYLKTLTTNIAANAAAANLNSRNIASINQALGKAGVSGFPITLATS